MEKLYLIMPAYNEEANIKDVVDEWYPIVERYSGDGQSRMVVIDDGSQDRTYEILEEMAKDRPLLCPLTKRNEGHGATVLFGYQYALNHNADYIFQTDSDGQTVAEEFCEFWKLRKQYDLIIGWRNKRQDGILRTVVTKILKIVIFFCFNVSVKDANTPFRLMSAKTLRENIKDIPQGFNLSNVLLTVIYKKRNASVKYIPITFGKRRGGKNSINIHKIISIGKQAVLDFIRLNKALTQ